MAKITGIQDTIVHRSQLLLCILGAVIFLVFRIPFFERLSLQAMQAGQSLTDTIIQQSLRIQMSLLSFLTQSSAYPERLLVLEQHNRSLYARLAQTQQELLRAEQMLNATVSSAMKNDAFVSGTLSVTSGRWIMLSQRESDSPPGSWVLLDGIAIGQIDGDLPHARTIALIQERRTPLVLIHQNSGVRGILRSDEQGWSIEFLQRVSTMKPGDMIVTIPDGVLSTASYPVAEVITVQDAPAATGTLAQVRLLGRPFIGAYIRSVRAV